MRSQWTSGYLKRTSGCLNLAVATLAAMAINTVTGRLTMAVREGKDTIEANGRHDDAVLHGTLDLDLGGPNDFGAQQGAPLIRSIGGHSLACLTETQLKALAASEPLAQWISGAAPDAPVPARVDPQSAPGSPRGGGGAGHPPGDARAESGPPRTGEAPQARKHGESGGHRRGNARASRRGGGGADGTTAGAAPGGAGKEGAAQCHKAAGGFQWCMTDEGP
eukprot:CAMPEP_0179136738 /NCGR_PEP_ID=MMETSP0796-20121207/65177_1 /TAXON_ID=73915 /ORGANISM="Pyrodinium bahamense, Strain pbaha01" /LENGTH=220 /DNA_ID=CAMNT_0020835843 /DNA_START=1 /DNA_END=663 /DNA_ORIENTATION=+